MLQNQSTRIFLFLATLACGLDYCLDFINHHASFFVDSGMVYRNMLFWDGLMWDYRHNRLSDLLFQIPGLSYLRLKGQDYDFKTWLLIMDWSRFGGEFLVFFAALSICLFKKNTLGFLCLSMTCFCHYFVFAANAGGNSGSALGFFSVLSALFFVDSYRKYYPLTLFLILLLSFSYQSFFIGLLLLALYHYLEIKDSSQRGKRDWTLLFSLLLAAAFLFWKIVAPGTPRSEGLGTFLASRPHWQILVALTTVVVFFILSTQKRWLDWGLALGTIAYLIYSTSFFKFEIRFDHAMNARSIAPLFSMISMSVFLFSKRFLGQRLDHKIQKSLLAFFLIISAAGFVRVHNHFANRKFSDAVNTLLKKGKVGCLDLEHTDELWQLHNDGVNFWSMPIISVLGQMKKTPDFVLVTPTDYAPKNGRRTCKTSYDQGLLENDDLQSYILAQSVYLDFQAISKAKPKQEH
jgi:hypothetical protein